MGEQQKQSWNTRLFLRVINIVGKSALLDTFMIFAARWLIHIFLAAIIVWLFFSRDEQMLYFIFTIGSGIVASLVLNWTIALFMRKPRPIVHFPKIKQIVQPHQTFKSFPSDHSTIAFTFALIVILIGVTPFWEVLLLTIASIVAISRVYVGVHYPRDILGGLLMAILISHISFWLATHVTLPLFLRFF